MQRGNADTVAVVDDDDEVREVLSGLLESEGHNVVSYQSAQDFLRDAMLDDIACLVVDQRMPQMTGLQLLLELERRGVSVPSLLITGAHDPAITREAAHLGAMTVMQKPVSPQKLLDFVSFSVT